MRNLTFSQRLPDRAVVTFVNDEAVVVVSIVEKPDTGEGVEYDTVLAGVVKGEEIFSKKLVAEEIDTDLFMAAGDILNTSDLLQSVATFVYAETRVVLR